MSVHDKKMSKLKKAVAMKYDPLTSSAPVVIAKGQGELAERIIEKAQQAGVAIQEDQSLVEVLSKLNVDQEIPPELFSVIAEILSFVYRADQRAKDWEPL